MQIFVDATRATRFALSAAIQYRRAGDDAWHEGRTVNISRSGVLFGGCAVLFAPATVIEFVLLLPRPGLPGTSRVRCAGRIVRHCRGAPGAEPGMAATIEKYDFLGVEEEAVQGRVDS